MAGLAVPGVAVDGGGVLGEQPTAAINSIPETINNPIFLMLFILKNLPFFSCGLSRLTLRLIP